MVEEIWKPITAYENYYEISNLGNVRSLERVVNGRWGKKIVYSRILKPCLCNSYLRVMLSIDGKIKGFLVHRLIAVHFIENPNNLTVVNHIDGNPLNNEIKNLEWVTQRENVNHFHKNINNILPGVIYNKINKNWNVRINIKNQVIHLGTFNTEEEAYQARINFEKENNIINKYV